MRAPWVKMFYFADGAYILPGADGLVTLGGIKDFGSSKMSLSKFDRTSIFERCCELVPSLRKAEVAFEWVGLRPFRQPVRVEAEVIEKRTGHTIVIHNYGHGGHGVSLSWGTAIHAARLVDENLNKRKLQSQL